MIRDILDFRDSLREVRKGRKLREFLLDTGVRSGEFSKHFIELVVISVIKRTSGDACHNGARSGIDIEIHQIDSIFSHDAGFNSAFTRDDLDDAAETSDSADAR